MNEQSWRIGVRTGTRRSCGPGIAMTRGRAGRARALRGPARGRGWQASSRAGAEFDTAGAITGSTGQRAGTNGSVICGVSAWVETSSSARMVSISWRSSGDRRHSTAATFSFSSSVRRMPTSPTVTAGLPSTHAIASWATDLPWRTAFALSRSTTRSCLRNCSRWNRGKLKA